ncbi:hypothetical protein L2E82_31903 [Cichorium intybus]|uniref:Uncharacterized protein n=1 Tax=Cichorium intybus TaxID=13427 RepID=A0ACB9BEX1_CICIN|nr:hypothetical protein L2E82_31903 [Cichorium intybus]
MFAISCIRWDPNNLQYPTSLSLTDPKKILTFSSSLFTLSPQTLSISTSPACHCSHCLRCPFVFALFAVYAFRSSTLQLPQMASRQHPTDY